MNVLDHDRLISIGDVLAYLSTDCYLDKADSAKYLGVGVRTFENWMDQLPRYRPGGKTMFKKSELDQLMKRHQELPNAIDVEALADEKGTRMSGILKNARHEHFAMLIAKGETATKAATLAGYAEKTARKQGSRLLTKGTSRPGLRNFASDLPNAQWRPRHSHVPTSSNGCTKT